jgi:hypothetical protein
VVGSAFGREPAAGTRVRLKPRRGCSECETCSGSPKRTISRPGQDRRSARGPDLAEAATARDREHTPSRHRWSRRAINTRPTSPSPPGRRQPYSIDDDGVGVEGLDVLFQVTFQSDETGTVATAEQRDGLSVVRAARVECVVQVVDVLEVNGHAVGFEGRDTDGFLVENWNFRLAQREAGRRRPARYRRRRGGCRTMSA